MNIQSLNPVLLMLLQYQKGISQAFLMQQLGISDSAIAINIKTLKDQGYDIQYANEKFILINPLPFVLIPEKIKLNIPQNNIPEILFVDRCTSTNIIARDLLSKFSSFFLIAREQYRGKGRMNRTWEMQKDKDLALSFGYHTDIPHSYFFSLIRVAALAVYKTLNAFGISCFVKWPNDIIDGEGKKICGILAEIINESNINSVVIGIGINVNSNFLPDYAASIYQILGKEIDINKFAGHLILTINNFYSEFPQNESLIIQQWQNYLAWLGEKVIFQIDDQSFWGIFKGCTKEGALLLEIDKEIQTFYVGDLYNIKLRKP
ncbi:BirA family transcriptional regulator, biotin operon repressor / biotin-[acetyl-CoA-carboxylase] ligase [Brevinema andersonii]|uniref:biotin--[biotin carboxyl-carrier protein] ligase n=1 Tax=Brevinema andersonii TaxID=34097 RepID=A0A1I1DVM3_BREAD|nr:biotin--[acetyl-CoA-carboxylase] ligase [Brevinema andersonii]SFB78877.1 BirA family transcriptional regulator, biotin operon repressor / biotin-[acetyl-CoA-carboxylase] ligase [Brevinema andersonii]